MKEDKAFYDKKIAYLDYFERGEKIKNGGFVKWEAKGDTSRVQVHIRGLYATDTLQGEIRVLSAGESYAADNLMLNFGTGDYASVWKNDNLAETGIAYTECDGIVIRLSENRLLKGQWRESVPVKLSKKEAVPIKETVSSGMEEVSKEETESAVMEALPEKETESVVMEALPEEETESAGMEALSEEETESAGMEALQKDEIVSAGMEILREDEMITADLEALPIEEAKSVAAKEQSPVEESEAAVAEALSAEETESVVAEALLVKETESVIAKAFPDERTVSVGMDASAVETASAKVVSKPMPKEQAMLSSDKWEQLNKQYPRIHPFGDAREYLSITPRDFVILSRKYQNLVQNSFLLHGYYNYGHVILTRLKERDEDCFYLGVPGVYFDREKQAALMFGFEGFEAGCEQISEGGFGYYMKRVEI